MVSAGQLYGGNGFSPRLVIGVKDGIVYWVPVYTMTERFFLETSGSLLNSEVSTDVVPRADTELEHA